MTCALQLANANNSVCDSTNGAESKTYVSSCSQRRRLQQVHLLFEGDVRMFGRIVVNKHHPDDGRQDANRSCKRQWPLHSVEQFVNEISFCLQVRVKSKSEELKFQLNSFVALKTQI